MATGVVAGQGSAGRRRNILILEAATATNSPPSGGSAGVAATVVDTDWGAKYEADSAVVEAYSSAGSATMTFTIRLWGYDSIAAKWFPLGYLNSGSAIAELAADDIRHAEMVDDLFVWDRWYAEVTAIGGTGTAVTVDLIFPAVPL